MNTWAICLIVILVIIVCLFVAFNFIFISKRILKNKDYRAKEKFNYFKNNPIGSNLKSIETLVSNNQSLLPILDYFKECNKNYNNQTDILKIQLQNSSKNLNTYKLVKSFKQLKQIENNFKILQEEQSDFKKFTLNTEQYTNHASKISILLFEIVADINFFIKKSKLQLAYPKYNDINDISTDIDNYNIEINQQLNFINSVSIHKFFVKQIIEIKKLFETSEQLFTIEKYAIALESIISVIGELSKNNPEISSSRFNYIKQGINQSQEIAHLTKNEINNLGFDEVVKMLIKEINNLENIKKELELDKFYHELFSKYFDNFKNNIQIFYDILNKNSIKEIYKMIIENFKKDNTIFDLTQDNINLVNNINHEITNFNEALNQNTLDPKKLMLTIYKICELILTFKNDNDILYKSIKKKYGEFLAVSLKLSDLEIKLVHISKIAKQKDVQSKELMRNIEDKSNMIINIKKELFADFRGIDTILETKIKGIEDFIQLSSETIIYNSTLIEINKRLHLYANRYYNKENKKYFDEINDLVNKKQYEEAINKYTDFISKQKKIKKAA